MAAQSIIAVRERERRASSLTALLGCILAALMASALSFSGSTSDIEQQLRIAREGLLPRAASGAIHIAEIDSRSIAALDAWPWPRDVHAVLVDRLTAAGAKTIAFDVDFSAPSTPRADAAFAAALQRAGGGVILPTFRQRDSAGRFTENLPIAPLREHAFLASVNVHPDADGMMRDFTYGTVTQGIPRPAMPAMLAGVPGKVGETFPVHSAISPASLPRHSVSDIVSDKLPPGALAGKTVIIGATAIELGDRYAMPRHGIQPGVIIQALAAETLLQGLALPNYGPIGPVLLALVMLVLIARRARRPLAFGTAVLTCLLALPLALELLGIGTVDAAAAAISFGAGLAVIVAGGAVARYDALRLFDAATGLPNDRALRRHLSAMTDGALIVMRIRNFDEIAELMSADQRLALMGQACARVAVTAGAAEIFSLGNGRLAWTMADDDISQVAEALDGLAALFAARITVGAQRVIAAPAFGIAHGENRRDPAHADLAASRAAAIGCRWVIYSAELGDSTGRAQQLLADLDEAMSARDIHMVFQPKLTLSTGRIDGVEALVRWQHPTLGPIPPDQFVPVFEDGGRMAELTLYIVDRCIEVATRWRTLGIDAGIAINVSAPLFADQGFVAALFVRLDMIGELARRLSIEITESAAVLDDAPMIETLERLRARGLGIAIDDYGTGQSTLSYLRKFPADEIKIDQSFIRNLAEETNDQILVRSTIAMAHELGFKVVAEGVENQACLDMLAGFGCDTAQGWHIGKGVRAEEVEPTLERQLAGVQLVA